MTGPHRLDRLLAAAARTLSAERGGLDGQDDEEEVGRALLVLEEAAVELAADLPAARWEDTGTERPPHAYGGLHRVMVAAGWTPEQIGAAMDAAATRGATPTEYPAR